MPGTLYIVSTPIGNLEDLTFRALRVLREADTIAAEDTRHSRKLLSHYGINGGKLVSYWGEREKTKSGNIIEILNRNRDVALISDAGTPGISDPGGVLIKKAIEAGIPVVPVPGPSAIISALTVSGISTRNFVFLGFVPAKKHERAAFFRDIAIETRTVVVYESPHRLIDSIQGLSEVMPDRYIAVCHELTKLNESVYRGSVKDVISVLREAIIAGEYVVVIEGAVRESISFDEALKEVEKLMKAGKGRKEAAKIVATDYGLSRKKLYDSSLHGDPL
ncbi:ribosomal RNA small subunit methyltransferase I [bacterium BMS3Abin07]|nr:ribosomal RNA small subunit methyltransferase I [bacterium BMS3Abin07]GBE31912.1 ribosomal RNA small subunit methyltransferase I [bacterium BMS3Bbin05]